MAQAQLTAAILALGPYAYYLLNEPSGLPQDSSGQGNHMTTSTGGGAKTYSQAGPVTDSLGIAFPAGLNERFHNSNPDPNLSVPEGFLTYIRLDSVGANLVDFMGYSGPGLGGITLHVNANRTVQFVRQGVAIMPASVGTIPLGAWVMVLLQADGAANWEWWIDGVLDSLPGAGGSPIPIGGDINLGAGGNATFALSNAAYFRKYLSAADITTIVDAGDLPETMNQLPYLGVGP